MNSTPIPSLRVAEVYEALETSANGLGNAEAQARVSLYGPNLLAEEKKNPLWERLARELVHPPAVVLLIAGFAALVQRDIIVAGIIWSISLLNTVFSLWREHRAEQAIQALLGVLPSFAHVVREGMEKAIPASEVVPGDILVLAEGDNIPADARVIEEYGLRTNNATLTGEAIPARKMADPSLQAGISELERPNLVFAGTSVASGTARAVVYSTGMLTQFGRIAHLTQSITEGPTPFQKELNRVRRVTAWAALGTGIVVATVGYFSLGFELRKATLLALGVMVAVIPEGLVATLTLSLAAAIQRLAQKGVLVKKPATVERLGAVSVICTDKSGTLTQNQMTVREIWVACKKIKVSGLGYEPRGNFLPDPNGQAWECDLSGMLQAAASCNNARLNPPSQEHPTWTCLGDQTEAALKVAAMKAGIREEALRRSLPRIHEIPFDARRKRMTTIHREIEGEVAFIKGAPREILQLCTRIQIRGQAVALTAGLRAEILAANDEYARNALRVLALARRKLPPRSGSYTSEMVEKELTFLGLMAMMDPPRPQVERAIGVFRQAGIRIVMITGDYGLTAESLARRVGMLSARKTAILTGAELDELSDVQLQALLDEDIVFARMAPEHKLRLVAAFQQRGEVVAVTGDGVNDAPALRKADVGISMGIAGTDVAREAADVILTQDDFGALTAAVEEGRAIYDNIRKFIAYIFSSNVPEVTPFIFKAVFPLMPLALSVRQILAIDLGTDMLPALALGMEKPEPDVMSHPPRRPAQPLINAGLLWRSFGWLGMIEGALCMTGFLAVYVLSDHAGEIGFGFLSGIAVPSGWRLALSSGEAMLLASTVYHAGVVMAQVGNALACRSDRMRSSSLGWLSNRALWAGIVIELLAIAGMVHVGVLARIFNHASLPAWGWLIVALYAPVLYSIEWLRKHIKRRRNGNGHERASAPQVQEMHV